MGVNMKAANEVVCVADGGPAGILCDAIDGEEVARVVRARVNVHVL